MFFCAVSKFCPGLNPPCSIFLCITNRLPTAPLDPRLGAGPIGVTKNNALFNIVKPFEKIREADKQNQMYAKSAFILHERTSKYVTKNAVFLRVWFVRLILQLEQKECAFTTV